MNNNIKNKLDRISGLVKNDQGEKVSPSFPRRYEKMAEAHKGELISNHAGAYCLVKTSYPYDFKLGFKDMGEFKNRSSIPLSAFGIDYEHKEIDLSSLLFVDTETTGLGGAGAVAFLVGCGSVTTEGFEIRQYLLPDYTDETAILEDLLAEFHPDKTLVSYNGAAFDIPLIRDRMIINRVARQVDCAHHLDLLHSARRLYRRRIKDCRLVNIEKEIFAFERVDDIPGYLIPSIYFEWLSDENLDFLPGVLEHNRWDIVTLFFLLNEIADIYESKGEVLNDIDDIHSLSKIFSRKKDLKLVKILYDKIDDTGERPADDILYFHSLNFKKIGDFAQAVSLWAQLENSPTREGYRANVELAKYYEHRQKDLDKALIHTQKAIKICPYGENHQRELYHRLNRIKASLNI